MLFYSILCDYIYNNLMLRIAKLTRIPTNLRKIPIRGGVPGWDRPDPPPSVIIPNDR